MYKRKKSLYLIPIGFKSDSFFFLFTSLQFSSLEMSDLFSVFYKTCRGPCAQLRRCLKGHPGSK